MEDAADCEYVVIKGLDRADEVREDVSSWLGGTLAKLGCEEVKEVTVAKCKAPVKDDLASWLKDALLLIYRQHEVIKDLSGTTSEVKDVYIVSQQTVVELQKQVIACKDEQLQLLQKAVTSSAHSVQETVKEELKTYSSVVAGQSQNQTLSPKLLRNVVEKVVEQEDRSRNVMIFGLPEDPKDTDRLDEQVADIFAALGEKPRVEATIRLGKVTADRGRSKPRAVQVTLSGSAIVHQLITKAKALRENDLYSKVFICPDLSKEQRIERRDLVAEQKRLTAEQPNKRHFIRGGRVESVEKN